MHKITKLLIANRGEIAIRVMRTAREMGIATVAVFSDADRNALHVRYADQAVHIGESPSSKSYLRGEKIISAALQTGAQAIHPGYGFLSENAAFAKMCEEAGIIFVGPSSHSIQTMGSKIGAKQAVKDFGVPLVPGLSEGITDFATAKQVCEQIGYPVLIKASAGGGGKGMRVVESPDQLEEQISRAVSEAQAAFGEGSVFVEKYFATSKHIEIQVLGDKHGNVVHLFERECSIQRRHQKLIEEAPSAVVSEAMRQEMGKTAVQVAKACGYYGAGTVEFIVDPRDMKYYFLEMNTRLQVEHPVTEMITGIDLVKEMIQIAEGKPLSFRQEDLSIRGHAIEVRVCAEDPANHFLPDVGHLQTYTKPQGNGIRVDDAYLPNMEIPIFYDPMIAKLIVYGRDRTEAIAKMIRAIDEYQITGIKTTLAFCKLVLQHHDFISGSFTTKFIEQHFKADMLDEQADEQELEVAAALAAKIWSSQSSSLATPTQAQPSVSNWRNRYK
jgi:acetyl-CoA carboxylase biotin carboxylase subunit